LKREISILSFLKDFIEYLDLWRYQIHQKVEELYFLEKIIFGFDRLKSWMIIE